MIQLKYRNLWCGVCNIARVLFWLPTNPVSGGQLLLLSVAGLIADVRRLFTGSEQ